MLVYAGRRGRIWHIARGEVGLCNTPLKGKEWVFTKTLYEGERFCKNCEALSKGRIAPTRKSRIRRERKPPANSPNVIAQAAILDREFRLAIKNDEPAEWTSMTCESCGDTNVGVSNFDAVPEFYKITWKCQKCGHQWREFKVEIKQD